MTDRNLSPTQTTVNPAAPLANLVILETLRGLAAIIVVFHHFALAFMPEFKQAVSQGPISAVIGWLFNGTGAVYLFFVLSGFVLTIKYFETRNSRFLVIGMIKRLPRLWPTIAIGVFFGYIILAARLNYNESAAAITGSEWLRTFAYADPSRVAAPAFGDAAAESILLLFQFNQLLYNTNLWTMSREIYGSYLSFFLAFMFITKLEPAGTLLKRGLYGALTLVIFSAFDPTYSCAFLGGVFIALLYAKRLFLPRLFAIGAIFVGISLIGTSPVWVSTAGALLIVLGAIVPNVAPPILLGNAGRTLGKWSFPLYVVHTLVICSISSFSCVALEKTELNSTVQLTIIFAVTWIFAVVCAFPLVHWERWWLPIVNKKTLQIYQTATRIIALDRNQP